ncbi:NAD(P)-dependent oxidoreductase [Paenibacillus sp. MWE-103]|uniref:NAD(P)-dependent oxidoreductase n=1 Tax=Paenibacillus artemisiicola TaxID=1172618 RepID=A0ABS3W3Z8_9BACL|nr:NAD(P)-dependent oxidoreductase [Paenibacillus artemisiicola]MBO7743033.1 NAD(P)-dependent oxidoreductase [Paenibacillus artemisiicola]
MRVFVAGSSGAVGRALIPMLVAAGHEVTGLVRRPEQAAALREAGAAYALADVFDRGALFAAVAEAAPEAVIHQLTALQGVNMADNARIRIEGTRNLVDASRAAGARRMIAQSISWAYAPGEGPAAEDCPLDLGAPAPRLQTVQGVHALETAAAEMPEHVLLRYGLLYGEGTWYAPNGLMAEQARAGKLTATDGVSSFVHIADAAAAAVLALNWTSGAYNVVDGDPAPGTAWLRAFAECLGAPAPRTETGSARGERGATNAKALRHGWKPGFASWREGFRYTLRGES